MVEQQLSVIPPATASQAGMNQNAFFAADESRCSEFGVYAVFSGDKLLQDRLKAELRTICGDTHFS